MVAMQVMMWMKAVSVRVAVLMMAVAMKVKMWITVVSVRAKMLMMAAAMTWYGCW